jgi:hypothetical protein
VNGGGETPAVFGDSGEIGGWGVLGVLGSEAFALGVSRTKYLIHHGAEDAVNSASSAPSTISLRAMSASQ